MEKIRVKYFDGKSSKGHNAALSLLDGVWVIEYLDKELNSELISWKVDQIESYQSSTQIIRFKYGEFPQQVIECSPEVYASLAKHYPQIKIIDKNFVWIFKRGTKAILLLTLVFFGLMTCIYFFVLPPAAEIIAGQIPMKYEKELGQSIYESSMEHAEKNDSMTYWVNEFAHHIQFNTHYPIHVTVVNEDVINAYAIPGGEIVVYRRIIQEMENKEELAALLAHEVSHIHYRHSLKSISRSLSGYLFMTFVFGDISGITAVLAEHSQTFVSLGYSRALEEEADRKGLEILKANGISQYGFVNLFQRMNKDHQDEKTLKFLSSHPMLTERIEYTKQEAQKQTGLGENSDLDNSWAQIKRLAHADNQ